MTAEKKDRRPLRIKNLADLKRHIKLGTELVATAHQYHPDIVGLTRVVTKVQTNGFYSKIKDQPDHKWSTCNHGMGFWSPFNKANAYHFTDSTVQVLNTRKNDGSVLYEMELYDGRQSMSEQNKEVPDMNEWERLHRQAQRYKEAYLRVDIKKDEAPIYEPKMNAYLEETVAKYLHLSDDYISLTEIARKFDAKNPSYLIQSWLRNRNTVKFLATWERNNNPDFNEVAFEKLVVEAKTPQFT